MNIPVESEVRYVLVRVEIKCAEGVEPEDVITEADYGEVTVVAVEDVRPVYIFGVEVFGVTPRAGEERTRVWFSS